MNDKVDRYKFESKLHGFGGFGKIIRGYDNDLERDIAVKVLADDNGILQVVDKERFRREACILAKLAHPNIPAIYDVVFDDKATSLLIIFQFIEGKNIRQIL